MSFEDAIRQLKKETEGCPLNILVWGPGAEGLEHFEKRQKIKREISGCFFNADVRFSEDLPTGLFARDPSDIATEELSHLAASDICIVLDTSKGAGEEIAYFARTRHAHKLLILTHEAFLASRSFPGAIRRYHNQLFYNQEQYDSCNLVEKVLDRIRVVALDKITR